MNKIGSALFALLLLPSLLFASKLLTHQVDVRNDHADLILTLDAPYKGSIRKTRHNNRIIITLDNALIKSKSVKNVVSPLLSKLTLAPSAKGGLIIAEAPLSVTMQAAKSSDGHRLRLRFEKTKSEASRAAALAAAAAAAPSAQAALPAMRTDFLGKYTPAYYIAVPILLSLLLLLLWRWRKKKRKTASQDRKEFKASEKQKKNGLMPRLLKRVELKKETVQTKAGSWFSGTREESGTAAPGRLQRILNPRNKLIVTLAGIVVIMLLLPKINLYYQFEHEIKPYGIILSGEQLDDKGLWLNIKDATLYVKQIESAHAQNIDVIFLGLYNRIDLKKIALSSTFEQFVPTDIEHLRVRYSVLDPLHITVDAAGDFGTAQAKASLNERTIAVTLQPSKLMKTRFRSTLNRLKKDETGGYLYESRF